MTQKKTFDIMMHDHNKMYEQHVVGACRSSAGLLLYDITVDYLHLTFIQC